MGDTPADGVHVAVRTLADLVARHAANTPERVALVLSDRTLSWGEFDDLVGRAAAGLVRCGLNPGDRVALVLPNVVEFPVAYLGALRAGCIAVPLNPAYTAPELRRLLHDGAVSLVVAAPESIGSVRDACAEQSEPPPLVIAGPAGPGERTFDELTAGATFDPPVAVGGEDTAVIIYTSGTSGRPRGAMLSHRALLANLGQTARIDPPVAVPDDTLLLVLPLFHIYGLNAGLGTVLWHGATGVLTPHFDPVDTLALLRRHRVSNVIGAPPMWVAWAMLPDLGEAFAGVRLAVSGAAPLPPEVHRTLHEAAGLVVYEGYGLTETAPVLTTTLVGATGKPGSVGRPVPGVDLRLVDDRGVDVDPGDLGEIVVRGANLFSGYWPDGVDGPDADGWWATGDLGYLDGDGDLHLAGRRRELILVNGFNVYPQEIEDVLTALPGVAEAAVVGVPHPYTGETVKAVVVPEPGAALTPEQVIASAAGSLARFKCPTIVEVVDAMPHTATGKVVKAALRPPRPESRP